MRVPEHQVGEWQDITVPSFGSYINKTKSRALGLFMDRNCTFQVGIFRHQGIDISPPSRFLHTYITESPSMLDSYLF